MMARWGKVNMEQLRKLEQRMSRMSKIDTKAFCEECSRELAARLLRLVIPRTPVGKYPPDMGIKGGTLRRGWTAKGENEAMSGGSPNIAQYVATLPVTKKGDSYVVWVYNPVHYASYVEFGHRQTPGRFVPAIGKRLKKGWVTGRFMLTKSELELGAKAPGILEAKISKFLEGCLG